MYEYRHVILPKEIAKKVPKGRLLTEHEWRHLGVQQSLGWVHFMIHEPGQRSLLATNERREDLFVFRTAHLALSTFAQSQSTSATTTSRCSSSTTTVQCSPFEIDLRARTLSAWTCVVIVNSFFLSRCQINAIFSLSLSSLTTCLMNTLRKIHFGRFHFNVLVAFERDVQLTSACGFDVDQQR